MNERLQQWWHQAQKGITPALIAEKSTWVMAGLGLLLLSSFMASLIEHELLDPAPPRLRRAHQTEDMRRPLNDFAGVLQANLFQVELGTLGNEANAPQSATNLDAVASRLSLKGFFFGFAVLLDSADGSENPYQVGDEIEGFTIMVINDQAGFVEIGDGVALVRVTKTSNAAGEMEEDAAPPGSAARPKTRNGGTGSEVKVQGSEYFIKSSLLDDELNDFTKLINQARVVPELNEGKFTGYRIKAIDEGSLYEKMGLQNNDIIEQINGQAIDSPEKAMNLFRALRNEKEITLKLKREDAPLTLNYHIQ